MKTNENFNFLPGTQIDIGADASSTESNIERNIQTTTHTNQHLALALAINEAYPDIVRSYTMKQENYLICRKTRKKEIQLVGGCYPDISQEQISEILLTLSKQQKEIKTKVNEYFQVKLFTTRNPFRLNSFEIVYNVTLGI